MAQAKSAGRPRDPHLDEALLTAAREVFLARGFQHASLAEVARHAGVGTPAIYRRWRTKADMAIDVVEQHLRPDPIPDTGAIRADLVQFVRQRIVQWSSPLFQQVLLPVVVEAFCDPSLAERVGRRFLEYRQPRVVARIAKAVAAGQLRTDTDPGMLADLLNGPIMMPRLYSQPLPEVEDAETIVDHVLEGFAVRD